MKTLSAFLVVLLLSGCSGDGSSPTAPTKMEPKQLTLRIGQETTVDGSLHLRLDTVEHDSRCPTGVLCVWAGSVEVGFGVRIGNGAESKLSLSTNTPFPVESDVGAYHVKLLDVAPYPHIDSHIDSSQYVVTILITQ